ncbi:uncharacterized protein EKO05_0007694 [Ascochyta rabiei]|uniref:uncharacterized protein n=1 Tax=Didymella rabiei TaxID=5454 RepID=UPI00220A5AD1|nr:uncharacterized protein EKO05_0007694 [Ascochyta rabiei]UPX17331.1 hypothetical protein EKO05_0007694 [Ascochyta rabiei]
MPANGLTKALPRQAHERFVLHLNLFSINYIEKEQVKGEAEDCGIAGEDNLLPK